MSNSEKSILVILLGGIAYGIIKLGDEVIRFSDEVIRIVDEISIFLSGIGRGVRELVGNISLDLVTIILLLVAIFFVFVIYNYISTEL